MSATVSGVDMQRFLRAGLKQGFIDLRGEDGDADRLLRRIGWEPAYEGLWVPDPDRVDHILACKLAVAHFGESACVTGASALFVLGVLPKAPESVELLRPPEKWTRPRDGLCAHAAGAYAGLRTLAVRGVRLTWAPRAVADHARHVGFTPLVRAAADAIQGRHCTLGHLEAELVRGRFPGCATLREAVRSLRGEHNHSGCERLARSLLGGAGVSVPERPGAVLAGTVAVAEVDIPFLDFGYGVEIDGPHHLLAEQASRDRARDRMLYREHGITIDRYLWFELEEEPERFVREVTAQLRRLGALDPT